MPCDKCGADLLEPDQKFCQKCGAIVKMTATTSQSGSQLTIMSTQSSEQNTEQVSVDQQKLPISRKIGMHSKRSLAFGITSLGSSTIVSLFYLFPISFSSYFTGVTISTTIFTYIPIVALIVVGLVFGILARSNGNKAESFESSNGMQKAGKITGLIGIIIVSLIIGTIVLFGVLSSAYYFLTGYPSPFF
ncbi:MAG: zinc ribbon domain-containing protein [Promethearchaeota archaeon]